jgi:hypothetical protein
MEYLVTDLSIALTILDTYKYTRRDKTQKTSMTFNPNPPFILYNCQSLCQEWILESTATLFINSFRTFFVGMNNFNIESLQPSAELLSKYQLGTLLGTGVSGCVRKGVRIIDSFPVAVKFIFKVIQY